MVWANVRETKYTFSMAEKREGIYIHVHTVYTAYAYAYDFVEEKKNNWNTHTFTTNWRYIAVHGMCAYVSFSFRIRKMYFFFRFRFSCRSCELSNQFICRHIDAERTFHGLFFSFVQYFFVDLDATYSMKLNMPQQSASASASSTVLYGSCVSNGHCFGIHWKSNNNNERCFSSKIIIINNCFFSFLPFPFEIRNH